MKKIFVLTGEPSGDKLASTAISKLKKNYGDIEYLSVGGSNLKKIGVEEIHIRIASPPIKYECFYGIDIPTREELVINQFKSIQDINNYLDSTTIKYINLDKIKEIMSNFNNLCTGCFNKNYNQLLDW